MCLHVSDMLFLSWLRYWQSWWHCVRNDPLLDQIPWNLEKSYVQLHRSPNIIKHLLFVTHKCVSHISDILYLSWLYYWHSWWLVFGSIQFWIKYHDTRRPNIIKYLWFATQMCVVPIFDILHSCWLWYWHCSSNCVRNDPVLDQIPWKMGKSYLQLHRSPHIIKYFWFATHMCDSHDSHILY